MLEREDQIAGLELQTSFSLCHSAAWQTHLKDVVVILHTDNFTSVAKNGFDPGAASEATSLESQLSFLHIKNALSQKKMLRQVRLAICENRRQGPTEQTRSDSRNRQPLLPRECPRERCDADQGRERSVCHTLQSCPGDTEVTVRGELFAHEIPASFNGTDVFSIL